MINLKNIFKKTGINLCISISSILLHFVLIEISFRLFFPQDTGLYIKSPTLGLKLKPNYKGAIYDWWYKSFYISINSIGLRDKEISGNKNNSFRIIALGDSQTFGIGVKAEETYPKALERLLNEKTSGNRYEVINTGVMSYGTSHELQYLKESGNSLKPDLILVGFFTGNDFADNLAFIRSAQIRKDYNAFDIWLSSKSHAYHFFKKRFTKLMIINSMKNKKSPSKSDSIKIGNNIINFPNQLTFCQKNYTSKMNYTMELTKNKILEMAQYAESKKLQFIFIIIPSKNQVHQSFLENDIKNFKMNPEDIDISKPNDILSKFARDNGIYCIDLLPMMKSIEKKQMLYYGEGHLNKEGHKFIAEEIYKGVILYGLAQ